MGTPCGPTNGGAAGPLLYRHGQTRAVPPGLLCRGIPKDMLQLSEDIDDTRSSSDSLLFEIKTHLPTYLIRVGVSLLTNSKLSEELRASFISSESCSMSLGIPRHKSPGAPLGFDVSVEQRSSSPTVCGAAQRAHPSVDARGPRSRIPSRSPMRE